MLGGTASSLDGDKSIPNQSSSNLTKLFVLAWPLIVSNSLTTIQITIDRIFLSHLSSDVAAAATAAVMVYWLPYIFLYSIAGYVATFVAQYSGAGRPYRVGPAVWQGLYFSVGAGIATLALLPAAGPIFDLIDHSPEIRENETKFFRCMCWYALPAVLTATVSAFFSGRGQSSTVVLISGISLLVTAVLDYCWIFGNLGFPALGIEGAGWATVAGAWASAILGLCLMFRKKYRDENAMLFGWRFEAALFRRLLRYGVPSSAQWALDITAFNAFVILTGWFGTGELEATTLVITINNVAFIPMLGVGQAVAILVGQKLGENHPKVAEQLAWLGLIVAGTYMAIVALFYVLLPFIFIFPFEGTNDPEKWQQITDRVVVVLWFVAGFSVFDAANIVLSFALRGAGDTLYVSLVSLCFAWPVMVFPTYMAYRFGWGLYWAWGFASLYIALQATCFLLRFRGGKWKSMRVIEAAVIEDLDEDPKA